MTPRSPTPMIGRHCDRYVVTVASPVRADRRPVEHLSGDTCRETDSERGILSPAGFREPLYPAGRLNRCALAGETDIDNRKCPGHQRLPMIPTRRCGCPEA